MGGHPLDGVRPRAGSDPAETLIFGIGNPILSDDRVGLYIAEVLREKLPDVTVIQAAIAGIEILDEIQGYKRVIFIDSIMTEDGIPGELHELTLNDLGSSTAAVSNHGIGLPALFATGRAMKYDLPETVVIFAIEIANNTDFSEEFTPEVKKCLPGIIDAIKIRCQDT